MQPPLFTFEAFYKELHLDEGVEDVLAQMEYHYSVLNTLTDGYKIYPKRHKEFLASKLSNVIPECQEHFSTFYQELECLIKEINEEVDIITLCKKKDHLDEKLKQWKCNTSVEDNILGEISLVKKRNAEMLRRIHQHTQEFCLRIMSAAEEMRENRRCFSGKIDDLVAVAKADLQRIAIRKFQEARVDKLREHCRKLQAEASVEFASKMINYKDVMEKLRFIKERVHLCETERDKLQAEHRTLPERNARALENRTELNGRLKIKLAKLEARSLEIDAKRRTDVSWLQEEKQKMLLERGKLQSLLAKENAYLCQIVKHCKLHGLEIVIPDQNICND